MIKAILLLAAAAAALPAAARDYFPLVAGNRWVYRDATTGQTMTIVVQIPVMHNGNAYYKVNGYAVRPLFLRQAENGNLFAWDEEFEREKLVTSFEQVPGGWFDTDLLGCPQGGQPQDRPVQHQIVDRPPITALQILYRSYGCADNGIDEERYAENIGLIRRVVNTIAGPRTYDLVYAKTSALTFDISRGNAFSVSLDNNYLVCGTASADRVTVGMRVSRRLAPPLELLFPSAQRYDIRVRDAAGEVVYQWSDDVVAAQLTQTVVVDQDLEYSQTIPVHRRGGFPLTGGYYTVEAWLTSANREFAGATRFFYSPCEPAGAAPKNQ